VRGIGILGSTAISAIIHDQGVGKGPSRLRPFGPYYACARIFERVSAHSNQQRGADKSRPSTEGGARMYGGCASYVEKDGTPLGNDPGCRGDDGR
jgi:hypothetical protein